MIIKSSLIKKRNKKRYSTKSVNQDNLSYHNKPANHFIPIKK